MKKCEKCGRLMATDTCSYCSLKERMSSGSKASPAPSTSSSGSVSKCPECGRVTVAGKCRYCEAMKQHSQKLAEGFKVEVELIRPGSAGANRCDRCGRAMVGKYCHYCGTSVLDEMVQKKAGSKPAPSEVKAPIRASAATNLYVTCNHDDIIPLGADATTELCSVCIDNKGQEIGASFSLMVDGNTEAVKTVQIPEGRCSLNAAIASRSLSSDYAKEHAVTVDLGVDDRSAFRESFSLIVRPRFDLDLNELTNIASRWVTPNSESVKNLLVRDGPIMRALAEMGVESISGYQAGPKEALIQFMAVYEGIRSLGMRYVSDTETMKDESTFYQRVKTPSKLLSEKTGNCIELSCLFASCMESMGLHPMLIYPQGHCICGLLLKAGGIAEISYTPESTDSIEKNLPCFRMQDPDRGDGKRDEYLAVFIECTAACGSHEANSAA